MARDPSPQVEGMMSSNSFSTLEEISLSMGVGRHSAVRFDTPTLLFSPSDDDNRRAGGIYTCSEPSITLPARALIYFHRVSGRCYLYELDSAGYLNSAILAGSGRKGKGYGSWPVQDIPVEPRHVPRDQASLGISAGKWITKTEEAEGAEERFLPSIGLLAHPSLRHRVCTCGLASSKLQVTWIP